MNEKGFCCVCEHELVLHLDEGDGWRCHSLGKDGYQCECWLRKKHSGEDLSYYDLKLRIENQIEDLNKI